MSFEDFQNGHMAAILDIRTKRLSNSESPCYIVPWHRGYKTFSMLNSVENEIYPAVDVLTFILG